MKTIKIILFFILSGFTSKVLAQQSSNETIINVMKNDDTVELVKIIIRGDVNTCFGEYSLLSQAVRYNAYKCFDLLLKKGADVNLSCIGYVPPLMHAAKYGRLEMVKLLVDKGANVKYKYKGENPNIYGMTPLTYAEKFRQKEVIGYLKSFEQ